MILENRVLTLGGRLKKEITGKCDKNDENLFHKKYLVKRLNQMILLWRMFMEKFLLFAVLVQCILRC